MKIQQRWLLMILSREKTMEVRSIRYKVLGQRIALGNSDNGLVEGYANVKNVIKIPFSEISQYEYQHHATEWLEEHYREKVFLYSFVLTNVNTEKKPLPYPKSHAITFELN
jgi:hypothetical protein